MDITSATPEESLPSGLGADFGTDPVGDYFEWNDRIFERYFPIGDPGAVRILSFDDSELRAVATEMGRSTDHFKESIRALIHRFDPDPFIWWRPPSRGKMIDREPPYYVGLLAAFSLAASQSGDALEGGQRAFFHRQLGHLLGLGDTPYVPHFSEATSLYHVLDEYLKIECAGLRGRLLLASSTFGGKYVWRARVQVLLSASSRRQLAFFFEHRCTGLGELTRGDIRAMMIDELQRPEDYAFSQALARTLELVYSESEELFDGFVDLVETEYVRWFLDQGNFQDALAPSAERRQVERGPRVTHSHPEATGWPPDASSKSGEPRPRSKRLRPIAEAITRLATETPRRRVQKAHEKRLVLRAGIGALPWRLSVQVRRIGEDSWEDVHASSLLWGEGTIAYELADGTVGSLSTDDVVTFANYGSGWIATSQLRSGDLCAILCARQTAESIREAFASIPGTESTIRECCEAPQLAIVTARTPHAEREAIPLALRDLLAPDRARVTFRRGLRFGTEYFQTAPPRVFFDHPTVEQAIVTLDGRQLPEPAVRRKEYPLPFGLSVGPHSVEVLGVPKSFTVTCTSVISSTDPFDCEGFEVCHARGVAIPVKTPGATHTNQYMNCRVVIVIGGLLL
jgi:hypothetical protein